MTELGDKIAFQLALAYQKGIKGEPISCPDMSIEILALAEEALPELVAYHHFRVLKDDLERIRVTQ